jgi:hypothetical protein
MRSRQTTLRPLLRWFVVMTLLVWTGAQVLCQAHCSSSACHELSGEASCHAEKSSDSHHGDENTPDHQDKSADASCETLKSALSGNTASPLVTPGFSLLYTLAPTALALDAAATEPVAWFLRQADRSDRVFKPAVCLGPAFHSQAPPVLL